jgi:ABC-2 type transport system ATP-binding protein
VADGLRLIGVRKRYRRGPVVLDGIDLDLVPGAPVAVAGANGSGKSTLLRIVAGCEPAGSGQVIGRPAVVGYLPDRFHASARMPAVEYLRHLAAIHGAAAGAAAAAAEDLLGALGFSGDRHAPVARLSTGNVRKVGIAQALCCAAGLVVLDEPWSGLDPAAASALNTRLDAAAAGGAVVLVSDHTGGALGLVGVRALRLADAVLAPDTVATVPETAVAVVAPGGPSDVGVTVELGCRDEPEETVRRLPGVMRWRPIPGGVEVRLPAGEGDRVIAAALDIGCSVLGVRRDDRPAAGSTGRAGA